jgi:hypothetical protein
MPEDRREKWTKIVFSETFFSDEPGDDAEIEKFLRFCRLLTIRYPQTVISINFLHKYQGKSCTFSRRTPVSKDFISGKGSALLRNKSSNLRFSNCSLIFWNGVSLSCYRKTTYTSECDDLVALGYGYDFGDWDSYLPPELQTASENHKEFAKLFNSGRKQIIAARTCSDIAFTPNLSKGIKLLLLTADDSPRKEFWREKVGHAVVCTCDATKGCEFLTEGIELYVNPVKIPTFIFNELSYILYAHYGDIRDEMVEVGCCRGCC